MGNNINNYLLIISKVPKSLSGNKLGSYEDFQLFIDLNMEIVM